MTGFEPVTSRLWAWRAFLTALHCYTGDVLPLYHFTGTNRETGTRTRTFPFARAEGLEPSPTVLETAALPLSYTHGAGPGT